MTITYEQDIVAWANEQASLIRAGRFDLVDIEHIAEEIEDVGKSEQRELESRMAVLLAHLLKWKFQPTHRGTSWQGTIKNQRERVLIRLKRTPSLKASLRNDDWQTDTWLEAVDLASKETGIELQKFPNTCPWAMDQVLNNDFMPD